MKSACVVLYGSLTLIIGITGCVNTSALQTARALEPGQQRILVGGGFYASPSVNASTSETSGEDVSLSLPYIELGYRRGIVDRFELGAKITVPGTVGLDGKYQLVNAGKLAFAAGLGAGYLKISSGSDESEVSTQLIDVTVPLYVSYDLASAFAVYASPKYVLRFASSSDASGMSSSATSSLAGATAGIRIGNRKGIFLETSYLKDISSTFDSFQVNGSLYF